MIWFCLSLVGLGRGIPLIGCGCACLLNVNLENGTDLPKVVVACDTPRCNIVCSLSELIELSVGFVRGVWVYLTWEFFGDASLDGSWFGFVVFTLWLMLIGVEIESEEHKELILVVGTGRDEFGGVGLVKGRVSDDIIIFFPCPCKNILCIDNSIMSSFV